MIRRSFRILEAFILDRPGSTGMSRSAAEPTSPGRAPGAARNARAVADAKPTFRLATAAQELTYVPALTTHMLAALFAR